MKLPLRFLILLLFWGGNPFAITGQDHYNAGWKLLDEADVFGAVEKFELAAREGTNQEQALLVLTMLYERINKFDKAADAFDRFFKMADDPYPEVYTLWFNEGLIGNRSSAKSSNQLALMEKVKKDPRNTGRLDAAVNYWMGMHYVFKNERKKSLSYFNQINNHRDWSLAGPFDNVMNSGYDKDFGVLGHPEEKAVFQSKYGASIGWFDPEVHSSDGYFFINTNFLSSNSIIYAQTFLESDTDKEVLLKFGYSGSLKLWINDREVYNEPERRVTELDYFSFKGKLNKGYNRVLVQLGDYREQWANFSIRFTDLEHNPLQFSHSNKVQPYATNDHSFERIPHFAIEALTEKRRASNDPLYDILLAKAYMRSFELNESEAIMNDFLEERPINYLGILNMILLSEKANNDTEQNRYYEIFTKNYPKDRDVLVNDIDKYVEEENKSKARELINEFFEKYATPYQKRSYALVLANLDEEYEKLLKDVDRWYKEFPATITPFMPNTKRKNRCGRTRMPPIRCWRNI